MYDNDLCKKLQSIMPPCRSTQERTGWTRAIETACRFILRESSDHILVLNDAIRAQKAAEVAEAEAEAKLHKASQPKLFSQTDHLANDFLRQLVENGYTEGALSKVAGVSEAKFKRCVDGETFLSLEQQRLVLAYVIS